MNAASPPPPPPQLPAPIAGELAAPNDTLPPDRQPALVYLAKLAPSGRRTMRCSLANIAHLLVGECGQPSSRCTCIVALPWQALRYAHTAALRTVLAERYKPGGANKHICALRGALKEAWRLGLMEADVYARAIDIKLVSGSALPAGRGLSQGEIASLFATCAADDSPAGARDAALFAVLFAAGLRRQEVVQLDLDDLDFEESALTVRAGKGRKERRVYLPPGAIEALQAWCEARGPDAGALFHPVRRNGHIQPRRLSAQAVLYMVKKRAAQAGVADFSPHDARRSYVGNLLEAGADLSVVQQLAGHSNPSTTARYDRRPDAVKKRAAGMLAVPYVRQRRKPRGPAPGTDTPKG